MVFVYILCAFLTTTSDKMASILGIFFIVLYSFDFFAIKSTYFNKASAVKFFFNIWLMTNVWTIVPVEEQKN